MSGPSLRARIASLEALIGANSASPEVALEKLSGLSDSVSIRRRIALLLKLDRVADAFDEVKTLEPDAEWVEVGVLASTLAEAYDHAHQLLEFAAVSPDKSGTLSLRATVAFSDGVLQNHLRDVRFGSSRSLYAVRPEARGQMQRALDYLQPFVRFLGTQSSPLSPLQSEALSFDCTFHTLNGQPERALPALRWLSSRGKPATLIARFVLEGKLPITPGLSTALKGEVDDESFFRTFAAISVAHAERPDAAQTFGELANLADRAKSAEDRGLLYSALSDMALPGGEALERRLGGLEAILLDEDDDDHLVRRAAHLLARGLVQPAADTLARVTEPSRGPLWKRLAGKIELANGDEALATSTFVEAALQYLDEDWLGEAAAEAYRSGLLGLSVDCLRSLKQFYPWKANFRLNLARLLWAEGSLDESVAEFESLLAEGTDEQEFQVAEELARRKLELNDAAGVLVLLDQLEGSSMDRTLLRAMALRQLGESEDAFDVLKAQESEYWDRKEFLFAYMEFGYAAGKEEDAHRAFMALDELRRAGGVGPEVMREVSIEEVLDLGKSFRDGAAKANELIVNGKMPWAFASVLHRQPTMLHWITRTQPLEWQLEQVQSRGRFSTYSTNGFTVVQADQRSVLSEVLARVGGVVCVDYTALITLQSLGLLATALESYESVYIPSAYRETLLSDLGKLSPHQLTRKQAARAIAALAASNQIRVLQDERPVGVIELDEYAQPQDHKVARLTDLRDLLVTRSVLAGESNQRLRSLAQQPSAVRLSAGQNVLVSLLTLQTMFSAGVLNCAAKELKLSIRATEYAELRSEIAEFDVLEVARRELESLWNTLGRCANVVFDAKWATVEDGEATQEIENHSLASLRLAEARNLSLLVDDRVVQAARLNSMQTADAAFGTDALLSALRVAERISLRQEADSLLAMMRMRYRFLLPSSEVLLDLSRRHTGVEPGAELLVVASYIANCFSDPGLFGGLERCTPPTSMALKTFLSWSSRVGEFLAGVWIDSDLSDDRAHALTLWTCSCLLPPVPAVLGYENLVKISAISNEYPLTSAFLRTLDGPSSHRVSSNLRSMAECLGISQRRFAQLVAEIAAFGARNVP